VLPGCESRSDVKRVPLSTSYRRRRLDRDLAEACGSLHGLVIDLGGEWESRPGSVRPPQRADLLWLCLNPDSAVAPDIVADVAAGPCCDACADAVVCTEVLEHVLEPEKVLAEAYRVLGPGGRLILSMPFMARVHDDPRDHQRYTATKLSALLIKVGFRKVAVHSQGLYYSVLADMLRGGLARLRPAAVRWALALCAVPVMDWLVRHEERAAPSAFVASHVAGHFVVAHRTDR